MAWHAVFKAMSHRARAYLQDQFGAIVHPTGAGQNAVAHPLNVLPQFAPARPPPPALEYSETLPYSDK